MDNIKVAYMNNTYQSDTVAAPPAKNIARKPKPEKTKVVDQHISRFANN
jgi:hypothetical protein